MTHARGKKNSGAPERAPWRAPARQDRCIVTIRAVRIGDVRDSSVAARLPMHRIPAPATFRGRSAKPARCFEALSIGRESGARLQRPFFGIIRLPRPDGEEQTLGGGAIGTDPLLELTGRAKASGRARVLQHRAELSLSIPFADRVEHHYVSSQVDTLRG